MFLPEGYRSLSDLAEPLEHIIRHRVLHSEAWKRRADANRSFTEVLKVATYQMLQEIHFDVKSRNKFDEISLYGKNQPGIFGVYAPEFGFVPLHSPKFVPYPSAKEKHPRYWWVFHNSGLSRKMIGEWNEWLADEYWLENIFNPQENLSGAKGGDTGRFSGMLLEHELQEIEIRDGFIKLDNVHAKIAALDAGLEHHQRSDFAGLDLVPSTMLKHMLAMAAEQKSALMLKLRSLEPFTSNSIMLATDDFIRIRKKLSVLDQYSEAVSDKEQEIDFVDQIIKSKFTNPEKNKVEIFNSMVVPSGKVLSKRQFDNHWNVARERVPDPKIWQPGRKAKS